MKSALLLSLTLILPAQGAPEPPEDPPGDGDGDLGDGDGDGDGAPRYYNGSINSTPWCEPVPPGFVPFGSYSTSDTAPIGGAWWLPRLRTDGTEDPLLGAPDLLVLQAGDGTELTPSLRVTQGAVAISVPDDAIEGTYLLRRGAGQEYRVLRVEGELDRANPFDVTTVETGTPLAAVCYADCFEEGHYIPRKATLRIEYTGGPAILDVWGLLTQPGATVGEPPLPGLGGPEDARPVDSMLMPEDFGSLEVVAGEELVGPAGYAIFVEMRDPNTLELLHQELLTGDLEQTEFTNEQGLQRCEDVEDDYYYEDDCCAYDEACCYDGGGGFYCGSSGQTRTTWPVMATLAAGLLWIRRKAVRTRERRRSC